MDRFASLTAFTKVVDEGGFAAAARVMGLSRSQVNKLVAGLESRLSVQLLNRTTRAVAATPAGLAFYERARTILADLAEAEASIADEAEEPRGELKINAPMSFGTLHLGPALADFMIRYPALRIQLVLNDRFVDPVMDGFDMTVRIAERPDVSSLIDHEIVEARRVLCAAPGFLDRHGTPQTAQDLARLPCLHYGTLPSGHVWRLIGQQGPRDIKVNGILCSNNAEVLTQAAVKGLGIALVPTFIAGPDLQAGRLATVLPDHAPPPIFLHLIYPPHRHLSSRIRALVTFLHERFGGLPVWDLVT